MDKLSIVAASENCELHPQAYTIFCAHRVMPWQYPTFEKSLMRPYSIVATVNDECVAYAAVSEVLGEVEIEDISVMQVYRKQGIASALLTHIIAQSSQQNANYILLEVAKQNTAAQALYEKHGFMPVNIRKNYYALANNTFDDALLLQKML